MEGTGQTNHGTVALGATPRARPPEAFVDPECPFEPPVKSPLAASTTKQQTTTMRTPRRSSPRRRAPLIRRRGRARRRPDRSDRTSDKDLTITPTSVAAPGCPTGSCSVHVLGAKVRREDPHKATRWRDTGPLKDPGPRERSRRERRRRAAIARARRRGRIRLTVLVAALGIAAALVITLTGGSGHPASSGAPAAGEQSGTGGPSPCRRCSIPTPRLRRRSARPAGPGGEEVPEQGLRAEQ